MTWLFVMQITDKEQGRRHHVSMMMNGNTPTGLTLPTILAGHSCSELCAGPISGRVAGAMQVLPFAEEFFEEVPCVTQTHGHHEVAAMLCTTAS